MPAEPLPPLLSQKEGGVPLVRLHRSGRPGSLLQTGYSSGTVMSSPPGRNSSYGGRTGWMRKPHCLGAMKSR